MGDTLCCAMCVCVCVCVCARARASFDFCFSLYLYLLYCILNYYFECVLSFLSFAPCLKNRFYFVFYIPSFSLAQARICSSLGIPATESPFADPVVFCHWASDGAGLAQLIVAEPFMV